MIPLLFNVPHNLWLFILPSCSHHQAENHADKNVGTDELVRVTLLSYTEQRPRTVVYVSISVEQFAEIFAEYPTRQAGFIAYIHEYNIYIHMYIKII